MTEDPERYVQQQGKLLRYGSYVVHNVHFNLKQNVPLKDGKNCMRTSTIFTVTAVDLAGLHCTGVTQNECTFI